MSQGAALRGSAGRRFADPGFVLAPGILPECPDFVHDRQFMPARGADRRQTVQQRGVGVQDVGLDLGNDLVEPAPQIADDRQLAGGGQSGGQPGRLRRAEELPVADPFARRRRCWLGTGANA